MSESRHVLERISAALKKAGAELPMKFNGTIESSFRAGLSTALAVVEAEADAIRRRDAVDEDRVSEVRRAMEDLV